MDLSDFESITRRLIKQKIRVAIARHSPIENASEALELFEAKLQADFQEVLGKLGPLSLTDMDRLSRIVNDALIEMTREAREDHGTGEMVVLGLADFTETFRQESLLPPQVFA